MYTIKSVFLGIILWIIPVIAFTQNSTNSPYTRYGYGILADKAFISQRGMGGIGYGLRSSQMINPMNPASFSAVDTMTFMFDLGISGQSSWFKDGLNKEQRVNGNLEYIAMQFLLAKKLGFGAGIEPVSYVGYGYLDTTQLQVQGEVSQHVYSGNGGQSKVYGILSYELFNGISFGVKLSYLFGDISHSIVSTNNITSSYSTSAVRTLRSYGFLYDFALQYNLQVEKYNFLTIGAVYSPKTSYGSTLTTKKVRIDPASGNEMDNIFNISRDSVFEMPESYGLGFTYNLLGKYTVGADVLYQKWADAKYCDKTKAFNDRLKFNIGGEFIPNRTGNNLLNRLHYRTGFYYTNSYLKVKDSKYNEYGVNFGFGIPMPDRRSFLNLTLEYSQVVPESKTLIHEQYFKISLSYTFNEPWFFKRKVK